MTSRYTMGNATYEGYSVARVREFGVLLLLGLIDITKGRG